MARSYSIRTQLIRELNVVTERAREREGFLGRSSSTVACVLTCWTCASPALAEDGCARFAWPVAQEREALIVQSKPALPSGTAIESGKGQAFKLLLRPPREIEFVMPPERKSDIENWRGGIVRFPAPLQAGVYQVTLSDEAWVDVVQNGSYAKSIGSSGRGDCPGLRKSVRFDVAASPIVLQISGASVEDISIVAGSVR
jgi:hypothetical protein